MRDHAGTSPRPIGCHRHCTIVNLYIAFFLAPHLPLCSFTKLPQTPAFKKKVFIPLFSLHAHANAHVRQQS